MQPVAKEIYACISFYVSFKMSLAKYEIVEAMHDFMGYALLLY